MGNFTTRTNNMNQEKKSCETNFCVCSNMEYICSRTVRHQQKQVIRELRNILR